MIETAISPAKMEEIMFCVGAQRIAVLAPWQLCATLARDVYKATVNKSRQRGIIPVTLGLDGGVDLSNLEGTIVSQVGTQLSAGQWRGLLPTVPESVSGLQRELSIVSNGWFRISNQVNLAQGDANRDDFIGGAGGLVNALEIHQQTPAERMYSIFNVLLYLTPQTYESLADELRGYGVIDILR